MPFFKNLLTLLILRLNLAMETPKDNKTREKKKTAQKYSKREAFSNFLGTFLNRKKVHMNFPYVSYKFFKTLIFYLIKN